MTIVVVPSPTLVELLVDRVMWAHYEPRGVFPPRYRVWRAPEV